MWKIIVAVPIALLAIAPLDLPYGYYTFLRIVVTIACLWIAQIIYEDRLSFPILLLGAIAIIYNPIAKISMSKDSHTIVNGLTILVIAAVGWMFREKLK